jgi:hypothetical protein
VTPVTAYFEYDDASATMSDFTGLRDGLVSNVLANLDGEIIQAAISFLLPISPAGAASGSEIEKTALFTFSLEDSLYAWGLDIAAFAASKFIGNAVDLTDTDVAALVTYLTSSYAHGVRFIAPTGIPLLEVKRARKTFRKHRKQTART